jgi:hypothetical protein
MVRIIVYQYNELCNKARKVEKRMLDEMLDDSQREERNELSESICSNPDFK